MRAGDIPKNMAKKWKHDVVKIPNLDVVKMKKTAETTTSKKWKFQILNSWHPETTETILKQLMFNENSLRVPLSFLMGSFTGPKDSGEIPGEVTDLRLPL